MIHRQHQTENEWSEAIYSDCGHYRYALTRVWQRGGKRLLYVLLNPSTATETENDPTIARCQRRAVALGYGAFRVVNLFALRATDPADLRRADSPVGPENDAILSQSLREWRPDRVLCGWGVHGRWRERSTTVQRLLRDHGTELWHLGTTAAGEPRHPLYIGYAVQPQCWTP